MTRRFGLVAFCVGGAAALALAVGAAIFGAMVARGWFCAFVLVAMVPIGSLALLMVHGISGGRWGRDLAPVLIPAARSIPLLLVGFLPVLLFRPDIYRWDALQLHQDVRAYYLNPVFFDARTMIALAMWSGLAWSGVWRRPLSAGLGLVAHLVLMTFIPADWVLTLRPGATSAGFGLGFGIEQIGAALGFAAALGAPGRDPRACRDLAGMIVSAILGTMYFIYMQFIVTWYGNIPDKVHWYVAHSAGSWPLLALTAFIVGAALPFLAILHPAVRREPALLRLVGIAVLCGIALHVAWLTAPSIGAASQAPAVLALGAMALLLAAAARTPAFAAAGGGDGR
ncbi:MAG TPA: hypothetical protein VG651_20440 [Stellaceae bacterium]|nr:hypothetical protein [Stellaceae bacterium]